jgi:hypothetical protein
MPVHTVGAMVLKWPDLLKLGTVQVDTYHMSQIMTDLRGVSLSHRVSREEIPGNTAVTPILALDVTALR